MRALAAVVVMFAVQFRSRTGSRCPLDALMLLRVCILALTSVTLIAHPTVAQDAKGNVTLRAI